VTDYDPEEPSSTTAMPSEPSMDTEVDYHPIRGAVWGLLLGIGVAIYLFIFRIVELSSTTFWIVVLVCIVLGVLWGRFGPAKRL
jgi:hypothetical protein